MTSMQDTVAVRGRGTPDRPTVLTLDQAGAAIAMLVLDGHVAEGDSIDRQFVALPDVYAAYQRHVNLLGSGIVPPPVEPGELCECEHTRLEHDGPTECQSHNFVGMHPVACPCTRFRGTGEIE